MHIVHQNTHVDYVKKMLEYLHFRPAKKPIRFCSLVKNYLKLVELDDIEPILRAI